MMHLVGATKNCDIIAHSSLNFLEFLKILGKRRPKMSITDVPNFKEIETWEGYFTAT